jgi:tRNA 2-thiouridine synthesizing protein A
MLVLSDLIGPATLAGLEAMVHHDEWDAGDLACGPMLLALKGRLERLRPGQAFRLVTRDEGAPVDVPAWCRLTGHPLLHAMHPVYYVARRKD